MLDAAAEAKEAAAQARGAGAAAPAAAPAPPAPAAAEPSPLRGKTEQMTPAAQGDRQADGRVAAGLGPADHGGRGRRHVDRPAARRGRRPSSPSREGVKLSFLPFFAKAAIDALKAYPQLNASIDTEKGEVTYYDHENLSVAVDTEKGLLTPVIKDAGDLSIAGLARKIADVADRTRNNKIGPDELAGGTFTLTNTGSRGALFDTPIINQPQVAILGTGAVVKRAGGHRRRRTSARRSPSARWSTSR